MGIPRLRAIGRLGGYRLVIIAGAIVASAATMAGLRLVQEPEDWDDEATRLMQVLELQPGMTVAEIGAGRGDLTVEMARRLGNQGRVFSTEIDRQRLADMRDAVGDAGLRNVTVIEGAATRTNLPDACCDAVYMREVYHHFEDPETMAASLRAALKPGGYLAVIDYPQRGPLNGTCHCIAKHELVEQLTSWGFDAVSDQDRWSGSRYLAVFRKR